MTTKIEKVLYQANATATGGRDGSAVSSDGLLNVKLAPPKSWVARAVRRILSNFSLQATVRASWVP